jgi:hypothetical protein
MTLDVRAAEWIAFPKCSVYDLTMLSIVLEEDRCERDGTRCAARSRIFTLPQLDKALTS